MFHREIFFLTTSIQFVNFWKEIAQVKRDSFISKLDNLFKL